MGEGAREPAARDVGPGVTGDTKRSSEGLDRRIADRFEPVAITSARFAARGRTAAVFVVGLWLARTIPAPRVYQHQTLGDPDRGARRGARLVRGPALSATRPRERARGAVPRGVGRGVRSRQGLIAPRARAMRGLPSSKSSPLALRLPCTKLIFHIF